MKKLIASLFSLFVLTIIFSTQSWAHAVLERTNPLDHEILTNNPESILLVFNEPIQLIQHRLESIDGDAFSMEIDEVNNSNGEVEIDLPTKLASASYKFRWSAISQDGHPINGTLQFKITD